MDPGERVRTFVGQQRWAQLRHVGRWAIRSYLVLVVLAIVVGLQVAPVVSNLATAPVSGNVAVVPLAGSIDGGNAASVASRLKRAREDPRVKAVVLRINSGGGGAASSEEIYMEVKRTAERMPVVVSVGSIAASGAYYSAAPADAIYVKPTSFVGSVGVFFVAPAEAPPIDLLITTGPNKLSGADRREWEYKIEAARRAFVGAVMAGRGSELSLTAEELSYARLYTGSEAVKNGLADRTGGLQDAINHAASMAGLTRYNLRTLGYSTTVTFVTQTAFIASDIEDKRLISPSYFIDDPGSTAVPNLLMLPPSVVRVAIADELAARNTTGVNATHANATG